MHSRIQLERTKVDCVIEEEIWIESIESIVKHSAEVSGSGPSDPAQVVTQLTQYQ